MYRWRNDEISLLSPLGWALERLLLALVVAAVTIAASTREASGGASSTSVPPAAQALASRLHIGGTPVVGNQPEGNGGPWSIWPLVDVEHGG